MLAAYSLLKHANERDARQLKVLHLIAMTLGIKPEHLRDDLPENIADGRIV